MATQIGVQMYTLREHCQTPSDIAKTCEKLKGMGFGAIQASAAGFSTIEAKVLKQILDDTGMVCAATHFGLDRMRETDAIVEWHQTVGCSLTAIGGFGWNDEGKPAWEQFAEDYNVIAKACAAKGLRVGYHNHSHELAPFAEDPAKLDPSETPLNLLVEKLDDSVWFEVDTYWIAHGGGDPAHWLRKIGRSAPGRVDAIHVKDLTITRKREHKMCEVGAGNLNWPAILDAAKEVGVKWYLIERDNGDLDPFESLKISFANLKAMGIS